MGIVSKVEERIKTEFEPKKIQHAYRVRENALRLTEGINADTEIIEVSALLHEAGENSFESSIKALALLSELNYHEHKKHKIAKLIHNHPFDSFILEQNTLFKADKHEYKEKNLIKKLKSFLGLK